MKRIIIVVICQLLMRLRAVFEIGIKANQRRLVQRSALSREEKSKLLYLSRYGKKHNEFIQEYLECSLRCIRYDAFDDNSPIIICIVKDDLLRIKMLFKYHRNLGVKNYIFLDDHSNDGTLEFLLEQEGVRVYESNKPYTTIRRQVWINSLIHECGYEKWYLILDSDELFDYQDQSSKNIIEYISKLELNKINRTKSILLDMFPKTSLLSVEIKTPEDILNEYVMIVNEYYYEYGHYDMVLKGGVRMKMFEYGNTMELSLPYVTKYPLIKVKSDDILINSHCNLPALRNQPDLPKTILRHYKFLPQDRSKYIERAKKGNFVHNSREYKAYVALMNDESMYQELKNSMIRFGQGDSIERIRVIGEFK